MANRAFSIDMSKIINNGLPEFESKARAAVKMTAENIAVKMQNYAKINAPWTDRTGHARQRLHGYAESIPDGERAVIAHGVDYGVHLERAHDELYGILDETVEYVGNDVLLTLGRLLNRLEGS